MLAFPTRIVRSNLAFAQYTHIVLKMRRSTRLAQLTKEEGEQYVTVRSRRTHAKPETTEVGDVDWKRARLGKVVGQVGSTRDIEDLVGPDEVTARRVNGYLVERYGARSQSTSQAEQSVLDALVATMLSQATSGVNSRRSFASLKSVFPTWEGAYGGGMEKIADAIRCGGLADAKAKRIIAILKQLRDARGEMSLEYLRDVSDVEVKSTLCALPGVGPKTAACVLMFCLGRGEFPVDTHVRRISGRLGWTGMGETAEKVYTLLNETLPNDIKYELHVLLIEHGRAVCTARKPKCGGCMLQEECGYFRRGGEKEEVDLEA